MRRESPTIFKSGTSHFYFIVLGIFFLLISGSFLTEGYSESGIENSIFAKQFAEGGTYEDFCQTTKDWNLDVSDSRYTLPFSYIIEAQVMHFFGYSFMVDKIYSVAVFVLCALLILRIWTLIGNPIKTGWLPLFFWGTAPIIWQSATKNFVVGPFSFFILLSVMALLRSYYERRKVRLFLKENPEGPAPQRHYYFSLVWDVVAALCILCAFFVRGTLGIYIFAMPIVFWYFGHHEKFYWSLIDLAVVAITLCGVFFAIKNSDGVLNQILTRYNSVFVPANKTTQAVASHFYLLWTMVKQMSVAAITMMIVCVVWWRQNKFTKYLRYWRHVDELNRDDMHNSRLTYRFIVLGLVCSLPLILSLNQSDSDVIAVLPLFAVGGACFVNNVISDCLKHINVTANNILAFLGVAVSTLAILTNLNNISQYSSYSTDTDLITDMHSMLPLLNEGEVVSATSEVAQNRMVCNYFYRYKNITFDTTLQQQHLVTMYTNVAHLTTSYNPLKLGTSSYFLYEKKEPNQMTDEALEGTMVESLSTSSEEVDTTKNDL